MYLAGGHRLIEREKFFLMPTEWFEPTTAEMEPGELHRHGGYRWWSIAEIASSRAIFVPRKLAQLLQELHQFGSPPNPVDSGE
jgi:hypothetical protein